jgi:hypothetical protein
MAIGNSMYRKDRLTATEVETLEFSLRRDGYRLAAKANEGELLPGEYLKRQRSTFVYAYSSPVEWEVVWFALPARPPTGTHGKIEARKPSR